MAQFFILVRLLLRFLVFLVLLLVLFLLFLVIFLLLHSLLDFQFGALLDLHQFLAQRFPFDRLHVCYRHLYQ